jgi:carbon monoxide dehydrogenase subunit G
MQQEFQHSFVVDVSRDQAWSFLWDIKAVAKCIPGCEQVWATEEGKSYKARLRRQVGPFLLRFELDISVIESVALQRIQVVVSGEDRRLRSKIQQDITLSLTESDRGRCQLDIASSFRLEGMLVSLGQRLLSGQIQQELDIFVECVRNSLQERIAKREIY